MSNKSFLPKIEIIGSYKVEPITTMEETIRRCGFYRVHQEFSSGNLSFSDWRIPPQLPTREIAVFRLNCEDSRNEKIFDVSTLEIVKLMEQSPVVPLEIDGRDVLDLQRHG